MCLQSVYFSKKCDPTALESGVPQGIILGPVMFFYLHYELLNLDIADTINPYADETLLKNEFIIDYHF